MSETKSNAHKLYRLVNCVKAWCQRYPNHSLVGVIYDPDKLTYAITITVSDTVSLNTNVEAFLDDPDQLNLMLDIWFGKNIESEDTHDTDRR